MVIPGTDIPFQSTTPRATNCKSQPWGLLDMPSDTAVVEPDVWQHLAVAHKNGQSITYFINGIEAGTRAYTGGTMLAETNKVLYIGAEWNGAFPFTGIIDRIRISNSALTADQLDSDAENPAAHPPNNGFAVGDCAGAIQRDSFVARSGLTRLHPGIQQHLRPIGHQNPPHPSSWPAKKPPRFQSRGPPATFA